MSKNQTKISTNAKTETEKAYEDYNHIESILSDKYETSTKEEFLAFCVDKAKTFSHNEKILGNIGGVILELELEDAKIIKEGIKILWLSLKVKPTGDAAFYLLHHAVETNQLAQAEELLEFSYANGFYDSRFYFLSGKLKIKTSDTDLAITSLQHALQEAENDTFIHNTLTLLSNAYKSNGEYKLAREHLVLANSIYHVQGFQEKLAFFNSFTQSPLTEAALELTGCEETDDA